MYRTTFCSRVRNAGTRKRVLRDAGQERTAGCTRLRAQLVAVFPRTNDDHHRTVRAHRAPDQAELPALAGQADARRSTRRHQADPVKKVHCSDAG